MSRHVSPSTVSASAIGFVGGPLLALVVYGLLPEQYVTAEGATVELTHAGSVSAAVGVWMAVWWLTEAIEIPVTALLPLALFPVLGARSMREAAAPYANELIFLFMGGFIVSLSMQRWGLHRRIALSTLTVVGTNPSRIVAGFMATTAGLSMWLSNSATTMMMLPIAVSVIRMMSDTDEPVTPPARAGAARRNLSVCLMLGIAYAASIGGVGTIIGSPPNLFLVSYMRDTLGREISFTRWLAMGLPLVGLFVPVAWYLLTHVLYPLEAAAGRGGDAIGRARAELGPMCWGERVTAVVFGATAAAWIGRTLLVDLEIAGVRPLAGLTDPGIAMLAATSLFLVPARTRERDFVMNWEHAKQLPWGILILFGGGLSLAAAIQDTGVGAFIGHQAAAWRGLPPWALLVLVTTLVIFVTELTSNTATAATFVPIFGGLASGLGVHPYLLIVPAALAASWAFMLPVATPPNAVVFGSGYVTLAEMRRAGLWLNLIGIALLTLYAYAVALPLLGVRV